MSEGRRAHATGLSIPAFLELATSLAQQRWPGFAPITPADLEVTSQGYSHYRREADLRRDGLGWVAILESRKVGPAEVIDEEEWRVTAWGPDGRLVVAVDRSGHRVDRTWSEVLQS